MNASDSRNRAKATMWQRLQWPYWGWLFGIFTLTTLIYLPGTHGSFVFDDFPNVVDNAALRVTSLDWHAWVQALWASPSSDLQRPLASLSFALNYYFTGGAPMPMKLTNLAIHLLNGALLFHLLQRMSEVTFGTAGGNTSRNRWLAILVTALWLLHPINLTAVLYVVQRMESLAQLFVLLALINYVDARRLMQSNQPGSMLRLWVGVPACTLLGLLSKESAVLVPVYALLAELILFRTPTSGAQTSVRTQPRHRHAIRAFFTMTLLVPGALGLAWLLPRVTSASAYSTRTFTLSERLLTEPVVLVDYLRWILLPLPQFFSFYRDDYPVSHTLIDPPWPAFSLCVLAALGFAAAALRRRRPLAAVGIAWFLAAHLLTATVIPLELVFDHRNYFASIGLLLAVVDLLLPRAKGQQARRMGLGSTLAVGGVLALGVLTVLCCATLAIRSLEWGNPVRFAVREAALHPASPRATYELGRTLTVVTNYDPKSPFMEPAMAALRRAINVKGASVLPDVARITLASRTQQEIKPDWWSTMHDKLASRTDTVEDASAIAALVNCQREGHCVNDDDRMLEVFMAATRHSPSASILYSYAIFAYNRLGDAALGLRLATDAAITSRDPQYQLNLVNLLLDIGQTGEAIDQLALLKKRVKPGELLDEIAKAEIRISELPKTAH